MWRFHAWRFNSGRRRCAIDVSAGGIFGWRWRHPEQRVKSGEALEARSDLWEHKEPGHTEEKVTARLLPRTCTAQN
ncbi:hypothetical protein GUJ93_ZPchr0016g2559 [Zizania palustris]|uniref:Uncharacterized protein n=1 Tax=Zizania palustris TaxID=103762 RepID=A0A8J5W161_ZIZPA|nr:hypothetical protein GUJ93_ZPchr0016g2559 [Zizania palustris]